MFILRIFSISKLNIFFRYIAESKFLRTKIFYPILPVLGLFLIVIHVLTRFEKVPLLASILFLCGLLSFLSPVGSAS